MRVFSIVIMGIGELFDNYKNFVKFISIVNYFKGLVIGVRYIIVFIFGLVFKIKEFVYLGI